MAEPRLPVAKDSTTLYRLEQLERQQVALTGTLQVLVDRISAMDARQQVHMKQTEMAQQTNDDKMDELCEKIGDFKEEVDTVRSLIGGVKDQVAIQHTEHAKLQIGQTIIEKYGPATGTSVGVSTIVSIIVGIVSKFVGGS